MSTLCIIGAGSAEFTARIAGDLLRLPEFRDIHFALHDIDGDRLRTAEHVVGTLAEKLRATPKISANIDRRQALQGADFVITTIQIGGYRPATVADFAIPKKYGLRQTIGDTLGIGGIMRGLRTIPVLNAIARDIADVCPKALWMQYVNPMAMTMIAIHREFPELRAVGLCHSVQGTAEMLAQDAGVDLADVEFHCAGINHVAFYTTFEKRLSDGRREDLYPRLRTRGVEILADRATAARPPEIHGRVLSEKVRYEVLRLLGYFVTESSEHFAEYVPWFIKKSRPDLLEKFDIPLDEYTARCEAAERLWHEFEKNPPSPSDSLSKEYAAPIMQAALGGPAARFNGNVPNEGWITSLPAEACVEVPCHMNTDGICPQKCTPLPPQLAALMRTNINVQLLTAEAALTGKREHIYHAALLDPHTAAELAPDEIYKMTDELIAAHGGLLPQFN